MESVPVTLGPALLGPEAEGRTRPHPEARPGTLGGPHPEAEGRALPLG